jgi:CysZ protein
MDFTLERHFDIKGSVRFVKDFKGLAIGNGIPFILMLMIPVAGVFFAPSLVTVAATIEIVERLEPA